MRGYKWLTLKRQVFYTGEILDYGWHKEDGPADGTVCRDGGYHILEKATVPLSLAIGSKINAHFVPIGLFAVNYRKRDILGQDDKGKLRVQEFKLLKLPPIQKWFPQIDTSTTLTTSVNSTVYYRYA